MPLNSVDAVFAAASVAILGALFLRKRQTLPLPPGPKGLPLIGNLLDMPSEKEWLTFAEWGEQWGDICSVTVLGKQIVILNSSKAAFEILDKKGHIYSDRPILQMGGELVGYKDIASLLQYGNKLRRMRRLFHSVMGSREHIRKFEPIEELETRKFLRRMLENPNDLEPSVRHMAGSIILRISHGYDVKETNDPFVDLAQQATENFSLSTAPGAYLVDVIPILRHLPAWFPGAGFHKIAQKWAAILHEFVDRPYEFVQSQMSAGIAPVSFTSSLLEGDTIDADAEHDIKWSSASLYGGGADTSVATIRALFLAMALHPEVKKKAQEEIDTVVGSDRLPTFQDRPNLPYLDAVTKEVLRWHTVTPTGVPHCAAKDDIHDGYFIPKGSLVIPNIWKLTHDPAVYPEPFVFNPDRFIASGTKPSQPDPRALCFGYGRRICPGLHLADASIFIACAMNLAVFDISKAVKNGRIIEPVHENTTGTISHPKPFECSIKPRSDKAVSLIQAGGDGFI